MPLNAEMSNVGDGEGPAAHDAVFGHAGPSGFDGETTHAVTKTGSDANHVGAKRGKIVGFGAFERDRYVFPVCVGSKFGEKVQQPFNTSVTDLVVRRPQGDEIGHKLPLRLEHLFIGFG